MTMRSEQKTTRRTCLNCSSKMAFQFAGKKSHAKEKTSRCIPTNKRHAGQPSKFFAPLKKKCMPDTKRQDEKWVESLFWDLTMITPEAQAELQVNGGIFSAFAPPDQRSAQERQAVIRPNMPCRTAPRLRRGASIAWPTAERSWCPTAGAMSSVRKSSTPTSTSGWCTSPPSRTNG